MAEKLAELRRILGPLAGIAICVGMAVGAGILRAPGEVTALLPDARAVFGIWILGALVATFDALILAEMAASVPRVGGLVAYVRLSFGPLAAFLVGWSMLLVTWPASLAVVAIATGELLTVGVESLVTEAPPSLGTRAIAVTVIAGLGGLNLIGLRFGARIEVALLVLKVVLLGGVFVAALALGGQAPAGAATAALAFPAGGGALMAAAAAAMVPVLFAYDGYADAVYLAGETRDPGRALPRALFVSLVTITGLYLLANAAFLHVLGVERLAQSRFPALDVARAAFGEHGAAVLTAIAVVVLLGAINAYFLSGPRIARLLAEEGLAAAALGRVPQSGAPVFATLWIVVLAIAYALTNTFGQLLDYTVPIISATIAAVAIGLLVQRVRAPERPRPFRTPAAWFVVSAQVAISGWFLVSFALRNPTALLVDLAALLLGVVAYMLLRRRQ